MQHARSCSHRQPRLCSSVALPLGINGAGPRWAMGWVYPKNKAASTLLFCLTLVGRTPGRNGNSRRVSGVLRAARWEASGPRDQKVAKVAEFIFGRSQRRTKTERQRSISALRIRGLRADRCHGELAIRSQPEFGQRFNPSHHTKPSPMLGPARRENRFRFSRPKNRHSPKLAPVLRPVSASLRLRLRSAAFSRACTIQLFRR